MPFVKWQHEMGAHRESLRTSWLRKGTHYVAMLPGSGVQILDNDKSLLAIWKYMWRIRTDALYNSMSKQRYRNHDNYQRYRTKTNAIAKRQLANCNDKIWIKFKYSQSLSEQTVSRQYCVPQFATRRMKCCWNEARAIITSRHTHHALIIDSLRSALTQSLWSEIGCNNNNCDQRSICRADKWFSMYRSEMNSSLYYN